MINISKEIDEKIITESFSARKPHIFNNDKMTFKQLKQLFTDVFDTRIIKFSKKLPKIDAYLTVKDGNWYVSSYLRPKQQYLIDNAAKLQEVENDTKESVQKTFGNIVESLKSIDPILLNRFFANGDNRLHVSLVCPPCGCQKLYNDCCFVRYHGIDCFSNGKMIGDDKKSSFELYKMLKANPTLKCEFSEITPDQLSAIKKCNDERQTLSQLVEQLAKLVDGIGWGCAIRDYIQDRYSRYIVNKALEHNIDVSKNGSLVDELTSRLSGTSSIHPTKSDLATFAKREGIDVKSVNYKEFLDDIEQNADQTNNDIMRPIENVLYYALTSIANIVLCYAYLDPNPKAQKFARQIASNLFQVCSSIDECSFDLAQLDSIKKAFSKLCTYKEIAPAEIRIVNNGIPYAVVCEYDKLDKIFDVIK